MFLLSTTDSAYFAFPKGLEDLDDVGGHADVDEHLLGELIPGELSLGQKPATEDENDQNYLKLNNSN